MVEKVYGIGVGPGDKDLLTVKAVNILNSVDTIFVPISKEGRSSVAYDIIKDVLNEDKKENIVELLFPMSKDIDYLKKYWNDAFNTIKEANGEVALITIGDPTLYSTFSYVWSSLKENNISVEIINGIPSPFASAGRLNIPLVEGDENIAILPQGKDLEKYLGVFDTIVVMKTKSLGEKLKKLVDEEHKNDYIVGIVSKACCENEEIQMGKIDEINFDEVNEYLSLAVIKKIK
ncbi:precorrin-2 C(20)-methyltransferase [Methanococcus aeolicus]|uniref:Precorrin-2 C20-methyltransferase n=1 Tax=Methanococcus aeolicus (strain ATCC BAA-1280 / DSM 17508 / OCM 812 / Nankai-3) TaxID=419665 RepID=A6UTL6_META3|nr:precorrin-2 C(20)-methyltransferase [Methanococcus aeolicus]ABR55838.1 precorrin-2 C20-methyltransferase [Methanococcus aeolicus Nankai-3]UXM84055.1 precorrin-2 C(20)-methyltransferase [Methanococcus aeolicus]